MYKLSIISGFLGRIRNRFMEYRGDRSLEDKIELAARVKGLDGLELCYPADFSDPPKTKSLMEKHELGVSSINFRSRKSGTWWRGSFTSVKRSEREEAVREMKRTLDIAADLGCTTVTTCLLNEGSDYLFELDYQQAYGYLQECLVEAAKYRDDMRISIEYKLSDPRSRTLLGNAGETLAFCEQVGMKNVGVTMDIGHSLYAGERPAQAAVLLARSNRLFHVHLNDNDKQWDWDMLPGAYNLWDFVEFFYYLRELNYTGWCAFDIFPKEIDTIDTFNAAIALTQKIFELSTRIEPQVIKEVLHQRDPTKSIEYLFSLIG
jgi:xylose isomerase